MSTGHCWFILERMKSPSTPRRSKSDTGGTMVVTVERWRGAWLARVYDRRGEGLVLIAAFAGSRELANAVATRLGGQQRLSFQEFSQFADDLRERTEKDLVTEAL